MEHQTKTFDEILYDINNLTAENFYSTFKVIANFPDEEQKGRLYDIFLTEIKTQMINNNGYEDVELLEKDLLTMTNDMIEIDPLVEKHIIDNQFNLENILNEKNEISTENNISDEYEIDKIENKIVELETEYANDLRKELLLFELNDKKENLERIITTEKKKITDELDEEIIELNNERIKIFEEELAITKEDINNLENNYEELSSADISLIIEKNDIKEDLVEEQVNKSIENNNLINYRIYQLDKDIKKLRKELEVLITKFDKKNSKELKKDTLIGNVVFENISDEELEAELQTLLKRKEEIWQESYSEKLPNLEKLENVKNAEENILFETDDLVDKIAIIEKEIEIRKLIAEKNKIIDFKKLQIKKINDLKFTKNAYYEILDDSNEAIKVNNKDKNLEDSINEFLNNHRRIKKINSYENSEKLRKELFDSIKDNKELKQKNTEREIKNKKLWLKALAATAGFALGLGVSCVPVVGTIRIGMSAVSAVKLAGSAINIWTKKHPNGKIAKVKNNVNDKLNNKIPRIMATANKMREKLKQTPLNCFVNGVAAGYLTGNIIELITGETLFENVKNAFKPVNDEWVVLEPEPIVPEQTPDLEIEVPDKTPIVDNPNIEKPVTPTVKPGISDIPQINEDVIETFLPKEGAVYDLSALAEGLVSSDATQSVDLIQSLGKEVIFDKAVKLPDGKIMWHFKQLNGAGYAWFDSVDVQELMSKASEIVSKTM